MVANNNGVLKLFFPLCGLLTLACYGLLQLPNTPSYSEGWSPVVVVTQDNGEERIGNCRPSDVAERLVEFFKAFNRGDQEALAGFLGTEFTWFSVSQSNSGQVVHNFTTHYDRQELLSYFEERHQHGERWELYAVQSRRRGNLGTPLGSYVDLEFEMARFASDLIGEPKHIGIGKGVFHCEHQTISVWSVGTNPQVELYPRRDICPTSLEKIPEDAVITCSG
jgi:hypothetical protein